MEFTMEDSDVCQDNDVSETSDETSDGDGPCRKRQRLSASLELFTSPGGSEDENASSSDSSGGPLFPSDIESMYESSSGSAIYPSDVSDPDGGGNLDQETNASNLPSMCMVTDVEKSDDDRDLVARILVSRCCDKDCLLHLTAHDVLATRKKFSSLGANAQRQWLMDRFHENSHEIATGKLVTKYIVAGREVCQLAWCNVHSISQRRVSRVLKSVSHGQVVAQHGNKGKKRVNTKSQCAKTWMERYFHLVGDKMPHNSQIHLPSWETQKDVYTRYTQDMTVQCIPESETVSLSMFYKIWNDDFPKVVIPEQNRFAKCDICVKIKMERRGCLDKDMQSELRTGLREHLNRVETERKKYHHHREKARSSPDKFLTIIIDGMDQAKTNLPNTKLIAKSTSSLWRLRTHITGLLLHTKAPCGKLAYTFVDMLQWPHDSNLTITLLLNVLIDFQKHHQLPSTLYVQMDNTSRENKNKFVLGFCAILVKLQIFQKIQINFLPVGHTHEDIDQLFSSVAREIRQAGCDSIPDLLQLIHRSSSPNPVSQLVLGVWDFKTWMEPFLAKVEGHSKYLVFRFTLNASKTAELHYKKCSSDPWEPEDAGIHLLSGCPDVVDVPPLVAPCADKLDLEHLFRDLPKYKQWLSASAWENWEEFIATSAELVLNPIPIKWELSSLVSAAITAAHARSQSHSESISLETTQLLAKETAVPKKISARHTTKRGSGKQKAKPTREKEIDDTQIQVDEPVDDGSDDTNQTLHLECGMQVACFVPLYQNEEPQIGTITALPDGRVDVEIEWMTGTYSEPWTVCKTRQGGSYVPWKEKIPISTILFPIQLTKSGRLGNGLKIKLKRAYEQIAET